MYVDVAGTTAVGVGVSMGVDGNVKGKRGRRRHGCCHVGERTHV